MKILELLLALALTALAFLAATLNFTDGRMNPTVPAPITPLELIEFYLTK